MLKEAIHKLVEGVDLSENEMAGAMEQIMANEASPSQIGAFLTAFRFKGETVDEVVGAARAIRRRSTPMPVDARGLIDTCGTGGDGRHTFNISTTTALVLAGAGVRVAKHGNRAVSSRCGSADVLHALGVEIGLPPQGVGRCIREIGLGFIYAPAVHPAMRNVAPVRRDLGFRTIFNVLGPLTNPAGVDCQMVGVFRPELTGVVARALARLGARRAVVVHGREGLDEVSISGPTCVAQLKGGVVTEYELVPQDAGLPQSPPASLEGSNSQANARLIERVLAGEHGPLRDVVLLNAAVALHAAGAARDLREGVDLAAESIDSSRARRKLEALVRLSRGLSAVTGSLS